MLLAVDECDSVHVVMLVVVSILVSSHNQLLLSALQANRSNWLVSFLRNIDICHILTSTTMSMILLVARTGSDAARLSNQIT